MRLQRRSRSPGSSGTSRTATCRAPGAPVCDGIGEQWFRDDRTPNAALSSPEMAAASEDATRFLAMETTALVILDEHEVIA